MTRKIWTIAIAFALCLPLGCNRQDADALSNIGRTLVQRAKSMPIVTPQAKHVGLPPNANPDNSRLSDESN